MITKNRIVAKALNAAHSRNAKFKVGDEVRVGNPHLADRGRYGRVVSAGVDGNPLLYDVDLGGGVQLFSESDLVAANARSRNAVVQKALNAVARNGDFKVGDVVGLKIMDGGRRDYVIYEVLPDSYRLCYADNFGAGCERVKKWPSDEFVDKHRRIKVPLNADTSIVSEKAVNASRVARNERVDEATGRRDIEQSLRKMAELAARVSHAKATSKATHDDYSFAGYIDLAFPDKGAADNFNPYDVIYALHDARSLVPKWAWGVGGFNYERKRKGNLWRIHIGRFET